MLRHEVAALSQQIQAIGQVVEASANATAHIYSALHGEAPGEVGLLIDAVVHLLLV